MFSSDVVRHGVEGVGVGWFEFGEELADRKLALVEDKSGFADVEVFGRKKDAMLTEFFFAPLPVLPFLFDMGCSYDVDKGRQVTIVKSS